MTRLYSPHIPEITRQVLHSLLNYVKLVTYVVVFLMTLTWTILTCNFSYVGPEKPPVCQDKQPQNCCLCSTQYQMSLRRHTWQKTRAVRRANESNAGNSV